MLRREKVLAVWLSQINPLVGFEIDADSELTFDNIAAREGLATHADRYRIEWGRFDNASGAVTDTRRLWSPSGACDCRPPTCLRRREYLQVRVSAIHPRFPAWATPMTLHFRRTPRGWTIVGLNRMPEA